MRKLNRLIFILLSLVLVFFLFGFFKLTIQSYQPDIRGVEPNVIYTIQQAMLGEKIYTDPERPPFAITQYTPLYYLIVTNTAKIFNLIPGLEVTKIYKLSRGLSSIFALSVSLIIFIWTKKISNNNYWAYSMALLALILPLPWFSLARIDAISAFFSILSVYLVYEGISNQKSAYFYLSGISIFLSIFSKQSFIFLLVLVPLFSLFYKRYIYLLYVGAGFISALITSMIILHSYESIWNIPLLYKNLIQGVSNGINFDLAYKKVWLIAMTDYQVLVILPLLLIGYRLVISKKIDSASLFIFYSYLFFLIFNILISIKDGAAINYLNETFILALVVLSVGINELPTYSPLKKDSIFLYSSIIGLLFGSFILFLNYRNYEKKLSVTYEEIYHPQIGRYLDVNLDPDDKVFSLNRAINNRYPNNMIFPQSEIAFINARRGIFSYNREEIVQNNLDYVVSGSGVPSKFLHFPGESLDRDMLKLEKIVGKYHVFRVNRDRFN